MEEEKAEEEREEEGKKERRIRKVELYPGMEMMGGRGMHVNRDLKSERHECHETPFCLFLVLFCFASENSFGTGSV